MAATLIAVVAFSLGACSGSSADTSPEEAVTQTETGCDTPAVFQFPPVDLDKTAVVCRRPPGTHEREPRHPG